MQHEHGAGARNRRYESAANHVRDRRHLPQAHEFFSDVKDDMADMIEIAARRGQILPVKDAYEKACAIESRK
jgi:hypothetical protein